MQSALANPQSSISTAWLPIEDAAKLLGVSVRAVRFRAPDWAKNDRARKAPPSGRGKPIWWIHRSADRRLSRYADRDTREGRQSAKLDEKYPQHYAELARLKASWLAEWRKRCASPRSAGVTDLDLAEAVAAEAKRTHGDKLRISGRSLRAWHRDYNRMGADDQIVGIEALVPKYSFTPAVGGASMSRHPAAIDYFFECYHTQSRLSVRLCHEMTVREAGKQNWSWAASYHATTRWLRDTDDIAYTYLMREGPSAWSHKYMSYLEIDYSLIQPGELFVCDHTQCDFWVTYRDKQIRPWLTAIEDCRSRCIVGWHLGPAPHQDAIVASYRMAFRDWAIPENMRIDNGKDFTSKLLTGITKRERDQLRRLYGRDWQRVLKRDADLIEVNTVVDTRWLGLTGELGIKLIYAIPYAPWSKGQLERWYGTFHRQCGKSFPTYCGNSVLTRPECLEEIKRGYSPPSACCSTIPRIPNGGCTLCASIRRPKTSRAARRASS